MHLEIQLLRKEEVDLFNKEDEAAFNVHARYFPDGIVPGAAEDDRGEYDLKKVMDDPRYTVLSIKDDGRFVGGAIVEETGKHKREIEIFFLIVEFFNSHHPDPHDPETGGENPHEGEGFDGMFRFEKRKGSSPRSWRMLTAASPGSSAEEN